MKESKQIKVKKKYWENLNLISSVKKIEAQAKKWVSYRKTVYAFLYKKRGGIFPG